MKKLAGVLFLSIYSVAYAADLKLAGVVYRSLSISYGSQLSLVGNSDMIIDVESDSGKVQRHYLEPNSRENYGKLRVKKITIYAP